MSMGKKNNISSTYRAGVIPYTFDKNGTLKMLFVVSSDDYYGGNKPGIAKGKQDPGEEPAITAFRELYEETGIKLSETYVRQLLWQGVIKGLTSRYQMHVYCAYVNSPIGKPKNEIKEVLWLTHEEFSHCGRSTHKHIVDMLANKMSKQK